jgi:hypothetical protein
MAGVYSDSAQMSAWGLTDGLETQLTAFILSQGMLKAT